MATTSSLPSLGSRLDSAWAKLQRAKQHIRAFKQSFDRFSRRDIYQNGAEAYDPGVGFLPSRTVFVPSQEIVTPFGIRVPRPAHERTFFTSMALRITLTPKADFSAQYLRWGVLVGEIIHNIASGLDNLIWELAQPLSPPPPATASSKVRAQYQRHVNGLGFPYTRKRPDWSGNCKRYLHFVPDTTTRAVLEEAQAFFAWENTGADPDTFPLEVVHELWNRDKHRTVNVATTGLQFQVMKVRLPDLFPDVDNLPSKTLQLFPLRPIEGETETAIIQVDFPKEVEFPQGGQLELNVNVNPTYTLGILFGQGSSAEGLNAIDTLQRAHELASELIGKFK